MRKSPLFECVLYRGFTEIRVHLLKNEYITMDMYKNIIFYNDIIN